MTISLGFFVSKINPIVSSKYPIYLYECCALVFMFSPCLGCKWDSPCQLYLKIAYAFIEAVEFRIVFVYHLIYFLIFVADSNYCGVLFYFYFKIYRFILELPGG